MKKRKSDSDQSSRDTIMTAAIREFSLAGYHGARVDVIAGKSGMNKAMIYYHFKSKEGLYRAIIEQLFSNILAMVREQTELDMPANEKLYALINRIGAFAASLDPGLKHIMMWEIASGGKTFIDIAGSRFFKQALPLIQKLYAEGIGTGVFRKDINPFHTHVIIISSIIFSNIISLTAQNSVLFRIFFEKNFSSQFTENLISIIKKGIEER